MQKKKFILTIVLPVVLSMVIGAGIIIFSNNFIIPSKAKALIANEKIELNEEITELQNRKTSLEKQNEEYDKTLEENQKQTAEIEALKTELDHYTSDVEAAKKRVETLEDQIAEKNAYLGSLAEIVSDTVGESISLSAGEYKCPADIASGRYSLEGNAKIYLYSIANSLTLKEDLSTLDTHSYKLEIESGETLKIENGTVTLTKLENN